MNEKVELRSKRDVRSVELPLMGKFLKGAKPRLREIKVTIKNKSIVERNSQILIEKAEKAEKAEKVTIKGKSKDKSKGKTKTAIKIWR